MHELSAAQRQLIILTIILFTYLTGSALIFGKLEGWIYDDALYFCVSTYTTIGFGDFYPKTVWGKCKRN